MDVDPSQDEVVVRAFLLDRLLEDRKAARPRPASDYRRIFPGHEDLVAAVLGALDENDGGAASVPPDPVAGGTEHLGAIGRYRLLRELGRGGQAIVYLAFDPHLRRRVALKVLPSLGSHATELAQRFQREAEVTSRLDHPNICTVHEAGADSGILYIAMRHVEGETLAARIVEHKKGVPSLTGTLQLFERCAAALHHAHEAGVIHRDVKPANILIDRCEEPVLLDFGLARVEDELAGLTRTGDLFGTPAYLAPEQLSSPRTLPDRRCDVYALGVSLYETLTGRRPFDASTREALFQVILTQEPPDPRHFRRDLPSDLVVVLETALAKEPGRRYATALDLAEDLRRVRCREPIRARPVPWTGRVRRWAQRSPARALLVVVLALALPLLGGLGGFLLAHRAELESGRAALLRSRLDRAIDRGLMALTWNEPAAGPAFEEALALDPSSLEATVGATLHILQPLGLIKGGRAGEADGSEAAGRIAAALAFLDQQERRIGRHPDLLRARLRCLEIAGDEAGSAALSAEIAEGQPGQSALGALIDASRHWPLFIAAPPNVQAAQELHRLASLALDLAPRPQVFYYHLRGATASYVQKSEEAERMADVILGRWPDDTDALLHAGSLIAGTERGRDLLREVIRREPDNAGAWAFLGIGTFLSDFTHAERHLSAALAISPADRFVLCRLGILLLSWNRPAEALETFDRAIALGQGAPEDLVGRGLAREALGDRAGAELDFREALDGRAGYTGGAWFLGRLLAESGRVEEGLPYLRRALEMDDANWRLWRVYGDALELAGRKDEARASWEEATRHLVDDPRAWNALAWFLVDPAADPDRWSPDLAVGCAELALRLPRGDRSWIRRTLGVALYRRGDDARAAETMRRAMAPGGNKDRFDSALDHAILAAVCGRLGLLDEASRALDQARERLAVPAEDPEPQTLPLPFPWDARLRTGADERSAKAAVAEAEVVLASVQVAEEESR